MCLLSFLVGLAASIQDRISVTLLAMEIALYAADECRMTPSEG